MNQNVKKVFFRFFRPHQSLIILLVIFSALSLCYTFLADNPNNFIRYFSYLLSAYTLTVTVLAVPKLFKSSKNLLCKNRYAARYLAEAELRFRLSLYIGLCINLVYAAFKLIMGIRYQSLWFSAIAIYYTLLSLIRFILLRNERKNAVLPGSTARYIKEMRAYRFCGYLLLILNLAITGMVAQMIWLNEGYHYPGYVIYASAAYTFYRFGSAVIQMIQHRKIENPLLAASKALNLSSALVAMFALQTAMFDAFGSAEEQLRQTLNAITGITVCVLVLCIALITIIRADRKIKKQNTEKNR